MTVDNESICICHVLIVIFHIVGPHVQTTGSQHTRKRPQTITEQVREEVTARLEKVEAEKVAVLELYELKRKFAEQQNDAKLAIYRKKLRVVELKEQLLLKQLHGQSAGMGPLQEHFCEY